MFPDQGPEPPAPRLADEDVAAVAVGEATKAVVAAGALIVAKAGRRAVGVRVRALERGRCGGPTDLLTGDSWQNQLSGLAGGRIQG